MHSNILVLLLVFLITNQLYANLNANQMLDLTDSTSNEVTSFDVTIDVVTRYLLIQQTQTNNTGFPEIINSRTLHANETPITVKRKIRQVFYNQQGRLEFIEGPKSLNFGTIVYNSEAIRKLTGDQKTGVVDNIQLERISESLDYLLFYRDMPGALSIKKTLKQRKTLRLASDPLFPDYPLLLSDHKDGVHVRGTAFAILDPTVGYLPKYIRSSFENKDGKPLYDLSIEITKRKNIGNLAVPIEVRIIFLDSDKRLSTFGMPSCETLVTVDESCSAWNIPIDERLFQLPFPSGITVIDRHRKIQGITGKDDPGQNIKELVSELRDTTPLHIGKVFGDNKPATGSMSNLWWWISSGVIIALLLTGWYVWRRRRLETA
jgi:LPXTG-motif cell wall-anchored protein